MNYVDRFGRIHDKPVTMLDPLPCNNAWTYTAYWAKLGGKPLIDYAALTHCIEKRKRHPVNYKITQQLSRDEWLGMAYLAKLNLVDFPMTHEFIPRDVVLPKKNIFKTIASFVLAIGEHRNYLHQHKLYHAYPLMFSVPLQDRAYYYRLNDTKVPILYHLIEYIDKNFIKPSSISSKLIRFLKYGIKPNGQDWIDYFGKYHPITAKAMELYK